MEPSKPKMNNMPKPINYNMIKDLYLRTKCTCKALPFNYVFFFII